MSEHLVLRVAAKLLIPFILLFALYVQWHGDYGPGGGFQAGVIFAAAFVLYGMVFGLDTLRDVAPPEIVRVLLAAGVLIYAGTGVAAMLLGGTFLEYGRLAHDAQHGHHYGIMIIEIGVGTTVAAAMLMIFQNFAGRGERGAD